jgi:rubrerythrin
MKRMMIFLSTAGLVFFGEFPVLAGRYNSAQCPETLAVLQLLYSDAQKDARLYLACARRAEDEGYSAIAQLYAAMACSETVLAENSKLLMAAFDQEADDSSATEPAVHGTKNNLDLAINVGLAGVDKRYSLFMEMIRPEGNAEAISTIKQEWLVKNSYLDWIKSVRSSLGLLGSFAAKPSETYSVCQICGNIVSMSPRSPCEVCSAKPSDFQMVTGCWKVQYAIENNEMLSRAEKGYARRYCRALFSTESPAMTAMLPTGIFESSPYKKWGLGPQKAFGPEESRYILALEEMAVSWQKYIEIDLDSLTDTEKQYLAKMHQSYGKGPINLTDKRSGFSESLNRALTEVEILSGSGALLDVDLIYLRRLSAEVEPK